MYRERDFGGAPSGGFGGGGPMGGNGGGPFTDDAPPSDAPPL
jgi:hypothetical protein